jgi:hypothetical protein
VMWGVHTVCPDTIVELPGVLQQLVLSNVVWLSAKYAMAIDEQEMMRVNWDNRTTEELSGGEVCLRHASVRQAVTVRDRERTCNLYSTAHCWIRI